MGKKCMIVAHGSHKYVLSLQDLKKLIFREKRRKPMIPSFESTQQESEITKIDELETNYMTSKLLP